MAEKLKRLTSEKSAFCTTGFQKGSQGHWQKQDHDRSGAKYNWLPFDRKYVTRPNLDYGIAYPVVLKAPNWTTKF